MNRNVTHRLLSMAVQLALLHISCHDHDASHNDLTDASSPQPSSYQENQSDTIKSNRESNQSDLFQVKATVSPAIASVGIVEWSTTLGPVDNAMIVFGPDTNYGWSAPVDLQETSFRTLLLGLKPSKQYHFSVEAIIDGTNYVSSDNVIETGPLPNGMPTKHVQIHEGAISIAEGFTITCTFLSDSSWIFVLDRDGDYVWWYQPQNEIRDWTRARLTYDGRYMIIANGNVPGPNKGILLKVTLDGLHEETLHVEARHHDVAVIPEEGTLAYIEYDTSGKGICDRVVELTPDGTTHEIIRLRDYFNNRSTDEEWCHSNALNYDPKDDAYTISVLHFNAILKVSRSTGEILWILGGDQSDFPGIHWEAQHQHHLLDNSILVFNNRAEASDSLSSSRAVEFQIDELNLQASPIWEYQQGNLSSYAMGDVKRLSNGNTLVTFSTAGVIHEVDPDRTLLKSIAMTSSDVLGYATWRSSMYGPPEAFR